MTPRARRIALAVAAMVALQVGALLIYRGVERSRTARPTFAADRLDRAEPAPQFDAGRHDGSRVAVGWPADRIRLVHFWATWCKPCRTELPGLLALTRDLRARGIELVAVAVDDEWHDIRRFFDGIVPPEVVRTRVPDAHKAWGVSTLPDTYLVQRDGTLTERYQGARDWRSVAARTHLSRLLSPQAGP